MKDFKSERTVKKYTQKLNAPPNKVFPLLCPTMEYKWIQPWQCQIVFSKSGYAEDNCVFKTDFPQDIEPETWIVSQYEENVTIQFIRFNSSLVIRHNIFLIDNGNGITEATIEQTITGLNEQGNEYVESYTDETFFEEASMLEKMLNYYLETGEMLQII